ncbi:MAG: hypothetical protein GF400_07840 [Candidatus Eisenbacteria bacterium]|nr:hypothetical protein [Candidatus Eisenbacteria bacterium]
MMSLRRFAATALALVLAGLALAALLFTSGCRKEETLFLDTNLSPETELTSAPGPKEQANYRVHLYWNGSDPDGYISGYFFAWDDTADADWVFTTKSDSLFKVSIDGVGGTQNHTFFVRSVDNEGKVDPSPAEIRFEAETDVPLINTLFRVDGPNDPDSPIYDPDYDSDSQQYVYGTGEDTVLMGTPCAFVWDGEDPDGMGAPVYYAYSIGSNPYSAFEPDTTVTVNDIDSSPATKLNVLAKDETGAVSPDYEYPFVMNYEPDSQIVEPEEETGTLTVPDKTRLIFHWDVRDKEELEGLPGGIQDVWIEMDGEVLETFTVGEEGYQEHWMLTSDTFDVNSTHYVPSRNYPTGGNKSHLFTIYARDVEGKFEVPKQRPEDREIYEFSYNIPPTTAITEPADGDTLCPEFTICWEGTDVDGSIEAYQYVLDPTESSWKTSEDTCFEASLIDTAGVVDTGWHEFRVRARDNSGCWETSYKSILVYVEECE